MQRFLLRADERRPGKHRSVLKNGNCLYAGVGDRADGAVAVDGSGISVMDVNDLGRGDEQGQQYAEQGNAPVPTAVVLRDVLL